MRSVIGRVGIIIKRCRYSPHGFWSWKPFGEKKWTPAMTLPQIRAGIAVILYNAYQCGTTSRMLHEQARRLQRHELARLYHWKVDIRLTHSKKPVAEHRV